MKRVYITGRDGRPNNSFQWVTEPEDDTFIRTNYGLITAKEMAKKFGVSRALMKKILDMLIPSRLMNNKDWSEEDDLVLIELYEAGKDDRVIASIMGRKKRAVQNRARFLNLHKVKVGNVRKDYAKDVRTCCGRFCERKADCLHFTNWLRLGKPSEGQLNKGYTTRCIQDLLYKDFLQNYDDRKESL